MESIWKNYYPIHPITEDAFCRLTNKFPSQSKSDWSKWCNWERKDLEKELRWEKTGQFYNSDLCFCSLSGGPLFFLFPPFIPVLFFLISELFNFSWTVLPILLLFIYLIILEFYFEGKLQNSTVFIPAEVIRVRRMNSHLESWGGTIVRMQANSSHC